MSPQRYAGASLIRLSEIIPTGRFRLVPSELSEEPHGVSELPVQIELGRTMADSLSFSVPWDGWLYGFVRANDSFKPYIGANGKSLIKTVSLHDWDSKFLLVLETELNEIPYYVSSEDVRELLENCLRPSSMD